MNVDRPNTVPTPITVAHLASGDRWGGAESQILTLLQQQFGDTALLPLLICMNHGDLTERARSAGIDVRVIDETEYGALSIVHQLRSTFAEKHPHILHTHRQKENVLGAFANLLSVRCKSVRTQHGAAEYEYSLKQRVFDAADRFSGRYLQQAVIAVSRHLGEALSDVYGDRVHVIHNGLHAPSVLASAEPIEDFGSGVHIGLVGRLESVKRVDLFIDAAALLTGDDYRFHIFGDGSLKAKLETQAKHDNRIVFHGHRDDINRCISGLDCLLMCSDHEGLPMTLLEAVALRTRVVARNMGGVAELLSGVAGAVLVEQHSAKAYATGIERALKLPQPNGQLPDGFSAEDNARAIKALYVTLLQG